MYLVIKNFRWGPKSWSVTDAVACVRFHCQWLDQPMHQGVGVTSPSGRQQYASERDEGGQSQRYQDERALIDLTLNELQRDLQRVEDQARMAQHDSHNARQEAQQARSAAQHAQNQARVAQNHAQLAQSQA